jgi:DNA polymerase-3 subunit gamma/tau
MLEPAAAASPEPSAIYRRWRSQRFEELIGQEPIVTTLRNAVAADKVAHAYLFVGPRGTGKTSMARILAKAINCTERGADGEPCDRCPACVSIREGRAMDVIEIDAASHGLVEDARDLVMRALTAPAELRRRVYIIDEVHMLSAHAFNALLKLVEEPPPHVVFILATTDTHKVPATVISRTQRFDFRRISVPLIVAKLTRIVAADGAQADSDALEVIAQLADGGMRDAESLLDQVLAYAGDRVTADGVREAVGLADEGEIGLLIDAYLAGDAGAALDRIEALADVGRDMGQVAAQAEGEARRRLLRSASDPPLARRLAGMLRTLAEAATVGAREGRARLALELLAVEAPRPATAVVAAPLAVSVTVPAQSPTAARPAQERPVTPTQEQPAPRPARAEPIPAAEPPPSAQSQPINGDAPPTELSGLRSRWGDVVERAAPAIKPLLRECRPIAVDGVRVTLAFPEERSFMRAKAATRAPAIEQLLSAVLGGNWAIECVAGNVELEPLTIAEAIVSSPDDTEGLALLEGVLRITGGELVEAPEVRS